MLKVIKISVQLIEPQKHIQLIFFKQNIYQLNYMLQICKIILIKAIKFKKILFLYFLFYTFYIEQIK